MKTLWTVLSVFVLLNVLAVAAGVGYLAATDRLDAKRVREAVNIFRPTIKEDQLAKQKTDEEQQVQELQQEDVVRLEKVALGPTTVQDRLANEQQAQEVAMQKIAWLRQAVGNLTTRLESDKMQLQKLKAELDQSKTQFEKEMSVRKERLSDQDFQLAVKMYEQLEPAQAKKMFMQLLDQNKQEQVLDYLAAMQLRKAAGVLSEFKSPAEVIQAANLVQGLRERGIEPFERKQVAKAGQP